MATFIIGLVILVVGAFLYGKLCEKVFGPDDRQTTAYTKQDSNAKIGFNVPWTGAYIAGVVFAVLYCAEIVWYGKKRAAAKTI